MGFLETLFKTWLMNYIKWDIEKYRVESVSLQKIRWNDIGSIKTENTTFFRGSATIDGS